MDKEIKIAIIAGIFVILVPIITYLLSLFPSQPTNPNIELTDVSVFYSPSLESYEKMLFINHTYLDFKIKNTGDEVTIIKSVDIKVLNNVVDYTPHLVYTRRIEPNKISLLIENFGWGPAKNVTFKDFQNHKSTLLISILNLSRNSLFWQGDVKEGSKVTIEHLYTRNLRIDDLFCPSEECHEILGDAIFWDHLYGNIEYYDIYGKRYVNNFVGSKEIAIKNSSLYIIHRPLAPMPPSAEYNAALSSESKTPYTIEVPVSHELPPNTADRFLIKLDTDKTATYDIIAYVNYDGKAEETKCIQLKIEKLNK